MTQRAVAHIVTADALALDGPQIVITDTGTPGDPEIALMVPKVHSEISRVIARFPIGTAESLQGHDELLTDHGWRPIGTPTNVETGYHIVDVEKI